MGKDNFCNVGDLTIGVQRSYITLTPHLPFTILHYPYIPHIIDLHRQTIGKYNLTIKIINTPHLTCDGNINSMIQAAKRKARGYHTLEGFANIIYVVAGKLDIESPFPMLF